jgi:hypothetical protein
VGSRVHQSRRPAVEAVYERYLGLWETVATATVTAGKINAFLTLNPAAYTNYPDATN